MIRRISFLVVATLGLSVLQARAATAALVTGHLSFNGYAEPVGSVGMGAATGIDFGNGSGTSVSGSSGEIAAYSSGTGSFAALGSDFSNDAGSITDIASFASTGPISSFLSLDTGGPAVTFDLTSITNVAHTSSTDSLNITATGIINYSGYDQTYGTLTLNAQGDDITTYSGTLFATGVGVPEPGTFAVAGLALAALALRHRKERTTATIA